MKSFRTLAFMILLSALSICFSSCGEDDGVMERPDYTSINYKLAISQDLLSFYDVTASYTNVNGEEKTENVTSESWQYKERRDGSHKLTFTLKVQARKKEVMPRLNEEKSNYQFDCIYSAEYYTKETSAKREAKESMKTTVEKEHVIAYVELHPVLTLADYKKTVGEKDE